MVEALLVDRSSVDGVARLTSLFFSGKMQDWDNWEKEYVQRYLLRDKLVVIDFPLWRISSHPFGPDMKKDAGHVHILARLICSNAAILRKVAHNCLPNSYTFELATNAWIDPENDNDIFTDEQDTEKAEEATIVIEEDRLPKLVQVSKNAPTMDASLPWMVENAMNVPKYSHVNWILTKEYNVLKKQAQHVINRAFIEFLLPPLKQLVADYLFFITFAPLEQDRIFKVL